MAEKLLGKLIEKFLLTLGFGKAGSEGDFLNSTDAELAKSVQARKDKGAVIRRMHQLPVHSHYEGDESAWPILNCHPRKQYGQRI